MISYDLEKTPLFIYIKIFAKIQAKPQYYMSINESHRNLHTVESMQIDQSFHPIYLSKS